MAQTPRGKPGTVFKTPAGHSGLPGLLRTQSDKTDEAVALRVHALQNTRERQQVGLLQTPATQGHGSGVFLPGAKRIHPRRHLFHAIQYFLRPMRKLHRLAVPFQLQPRLPAPAGRKMLIVAQGRDFGGCIWRAGDQ